MNISVLILLTSLGSSPNPPANEGALSSGWGAGVVVVMSHFLFAKGSEVAQGAHLKGQAW